MSSNAGIILKISIFGESHGRAVGMTVDGLPSGIKIDYNFIKSELQKRNPDDEFSTKRKEPDDVIFLSGVFNDLTTGTPLTFIIENKDVDSNNYVNGQIRPSHADYTNFVKSDGFNDYRGGGFSSGRVTAPIIVLGAICKQILEKKNILIGSHILSIHGVFDDEFDSNKLVEEINYSNNSIFPVLNEAKLEDMKNEIRKAMEINDSVGGILETAINGLPAGIGEPFFDSLESYISKLVFSVGGVKGITFGAGCNFASKYGSEVADELSYINGEVAFKQNNNGGILGGISSGQPIIFKTIVKPTPSISKELHSINVVNKENVLLKNKGRFDACIVQRVRNVVDSLVAYALVDLLMVNESKKI